MKSHRKYAYLCVGILVLSVLILFAATNSTLFLNSRLDRIVERGLPTIQIEDGATVYCRMKAADFRFPLPQGGVAEAPTISSGGFDTVEGSVVVTFPEGKSMSPETYLKAIEGKVPDGGKISAIDPGQAESLLVRFSYFGDK